MYARLMRCGCTGCSDSVIYQWDTATGAALRELRGHSGAVVGVLWHGSSLLSAAADGICLEWRPGSGMRVVSHHPCAASSLCLSEGKMVTGLIDGRGCLVAIDGQGMQYPQHLLHHWVIALLQHCAVQAVSTASIASLGDCIIAALHCAGTVHCEVVDRCRHLHE